MTLATTLIAVGVPVETANRLGYQNAVPLDGNGVTQGSATQILETNTFVTLGTQIGDTAFILPAEAEFMQEYFALNTTAETALVYPPVGDTIDNLALNAPITIETDKSRVIWRVEEGRWVSVMTGQDQTAGTVTSVGLSVPTGFDVAGSPITTSGTFAVTYTAGFQGFTTVEAELIATALQPAAIGVTVQAHSANLDDWSAVNPSAYSTSAQIAAAYQPLDADLTSWAAVVRASGFDTFTTSPSAANLAALVTGDTGTGNLVFATSPSFTTDIRPVSNDGASLGISGTAWSDLFLASGGVINWAAGDVTVTHSSNQLDFAGGNYTFSGAVTVGSATLLSGRTLTLDGINSGNGQPALAFNAPGHTSAQKVLGLVYDGQLFLTKPGLIIQNLSDVGAFVSNSAVIWRDGSLTLGGQTAPPNPGDLYIQSGALSRDSPVTKTADFTVGANENWLINNKSGSSCTVTLPAASSFPGREIMIKNIQAQAVNSASSNVVPLAGGAAGTVILTNAAGRWVTLVSDGSNWVAMQGVI